MGFIVPGIQISSKLKDLKKPLCTTKRLNPELIHLKASDMKEFNSKYSKKIDPRSIRTPDYKFRLDWYVKKEKRSLPGYFDSNKTKRQRHSKRKAEKQASLIDLPVEILLNIVIATGEIDSLSRLNKEFNSIITANKKYISWKIIESKYVSVIEFKSRRHSFMKRRVSNEEHHDHSICALSTKLDSKAGIPARKIYKSPYRLVVLAEQVLNDPCFTYDILYTIDPDLILPTVDLNRLNERMVSLKTLERSNNFLDADEQINVETKGKLIKEFSNIAVIDFPYLNEHDYLDVDYIHSRYADKLKIIKYLINADICKFSTTPEINILLSLNLNSAGGRKFFVDVVDLINDKDERKASDHKWVLHNNEIIKLLACSSTKALSPTPNAGDTATTDTTVEENINNEPTEIGRNSHENPAKEVELNDCQLIITCLQLEHYSLLAPLLEHFDKDKLSHDSKLWGYILDEKDYTALHILEENDVKPTSKTLNLATRTAR